MPFAGFENFEACVTEMMDKQGYDKETAKKVCGKIQSRVGDLTVDLPDEIIVDVVLSKEMIYQYEDGKALKTFAELQKVAKNHPSLPVIYNHPMSRIVESQDDIIGVADQIRADDVIRALKGKLHIWKSDNLLGITKSVILALQKNIPLDVSIGWSSGDRGNKGNFLGEEYDYTQDKLIPNHLAITIENEGRCGLRHGCGTKPDAKAEQKAEQSEHSVGIIYDKVEILPNTNENSNKITEDEHMGDKEKIEELQTRISGLETEKTDLTKKLTDYQKQNEELTQAMKERMIGDIEANSDYKKEDLQGKCLHDLKLIGDTLQKIKKPAETPEDKTEYLPTGGKDKVGDMRVPLYDLREERLAKGGN